MKWAVGSCNLRADRPVPTQAAVQITLVDSCIVDDTKLLIQQAVMSARQKLDAIAEPMREKANCQGGKRNRIARLGAGMLTERLVGLEGGSGGRKGRMGRWGERAERVVGHNQASMIMQTAAVCLVAAAVCGAPLRYGCLCLQLAIQKERE